MAERHPMLSAGASLVEGGVRFALFSEIAERVEVCLFDPVNGQETARHTLRQRSGDLWHDVLPGLGPGQHYGYRVHGPYEPDLGLRCNPAKLLIDPYARQLAGEFHWHDAIFGYQRGHRLGHYSFDRRDSAPWVPRCVVIEDRRADPDRRPRRAWRDTVIYEMHLAGLSRVCPDLPGPLRGSPSALLDPALLDHLQDLGVTAVELLPVQYAISELPLSRRGLSNYWGYNPLALMAPAGPRLGLDTASDLARIVDGLHEVGIEVLLDVVFNHTAEGDETGPTLSLRGIDNPSYYLLDPEQPARYRNYSGCGNSLRCGHPAVARLIVDSLRCWAEFTGVDGFRFDLGVSLLRDAGGRPDGQYLMGAIMTDPLLSQLKLIAEPWDLGPDGYRLGDFPGHWGEWNDRFRNTVRGFWAGSPATVADLATRIAGSGDVFAGRRRLPTASINFVTSHDGFTLLDLVSHGAPRKTAENALDPEEEPRQDRDDGALEAAHAEPVVIGCLLRARRSLLATLILARGVPMLLAGDEFGNSQGGNHNAYCQDNPVGWVDWQGRDDPDLDLRGFIAGLVGLRRELPELSADHYVDDQGRRRDAPALAPEYGLRWLRGDGERMGPGDWHDLENRSLICEISNPSHPRRVLWILHGGDAALSWQLPEAEFGTWHRVLDTASASGFPAPNAQPVAGAVEVAAGSVVLLVDRP
ncbi:MAG: glycogen debranching enzyme GlgX [Wenzhouxiangella sp.]|nr:MAG: glycogen debranching enzyme GlgX [Wenzhouxiangella sp.]